MTVILLGIVRICSSLLKCNYLKSEKLFLHFLFHLWNLLQILKILTKRMLVIADVFPRLLTVKDLFRPLCKKHRFRRSFGSQHVKGSQTLVKSAWEHFYHIFWSLWREMIHKLSPLLKFEILGVFVKAMTADDMYPFWDCENLQLLIQMHLS